jgi:protein TonB
MFEDSTFESTGRIHTRSRRWMMAAFAFNTSILLAFVLVPLFFPEALPRQFIAYLMEAPAQPLTPTPTLQQTAHPFRGAPEIQDGHIFAPSRIPDHISLFATPEQPPAGQFTAMESDDNGTGNLFHGQSVPRIVHPEVKAPAHIPSAVESGLLLRKTIPVYPPIAVAARVEGTVVLEASISKTGTIENLSVASGPPLLQQAALDAVRSWIYRPYLLDGQPVEVQTTVNVIFKLGE